MTDVPLFPLERTVLFPHMVLPLVIFEQRYRLMISECLKNNSPFGVLLLREGEEVQEGRSLPQPLQPHTIGTLARITEVAKAPDGRMVISTIGTERFRLMEYRNDKPYMTGDIELWPEEEINSAPARYEADQVRAVFENYLRILMDLAGKEIQGLEIPDEPHILSYLVPNWLKISMEDMQKLLEAPNPHERLRAERLILISETTFLQKIKEKAAEEPDFEEDASASADDPMPGTKPGYNPGTRFSKN